jgi:hypothetical protein
MPMGFYFKETPSPGDFEDEMIHNAVLASPTIDPMVTAELFLSCCPYFSMCHFSLSMFLGIWTK